MNKFLVIGVAIVVAFLVLVFLPIPGYSNVQVQVTLGETCILGFCYYSVNSVNPTVTGSATVIDLAILFPSLFGQSIAGPCISCQYKLTVALSNGQSASGSETKFISNLFSINQQDTVTLGIGYVNAGTYGITATLALNGATVATGSSSVTTPPGGW